MKRGLLLLLLCSCGEKPPPRPTVQPYALQRVVAAARERHPPFVAETAAAEPTELLEQVLGALGERDERLKALARKDAQGLSLGELAALRAILFDASAPDERRAAAAEALGALERPEAELALLEFLPDLRTPAWLRALVTFQWGRRTENRFLGRALLRLKYEPDDESVIWLADALLRHGSQAGADALRVLVSRAHTEELRALAADRLQAVEAASESSAAPQADQLSEAWTWISKLSDWDLRQVDDARFVLQRMPDWVVPLLCECLREENVYTRVHAAQTLGRRGPRAASAREALLAALGERQLAPTAAEALGELKDPSVRGELERCLAQSRDLDLAVAAARALGRLGDPAALPALTAVLSPPDLLFAARIARAELGSAAQVAPDLLSVLEGAPGDAEAAAHALGAWIAAGALRSRWEALVPAPGTIETAEQARARRAAMAQLVREQLGKP